MQTINGGDGPRKQGRAIGWLRVSILDIIMIAAIGIFVGVVLGATVTFVIAFG